MIGNAAPPSHPVLAHKVPSDPACQMFDGTLGPGVNHLLHIESLSRSEHRMRSTRHLTGILFPLSLALTNSAGAQQAKPPEVLVLATGGTIASTGNYYGDRGGPV